MSIADEHDMSKNKPLAKPPKKTVSGMLQSAVNAASGIKKDK